MHLIPTKIQPISTRFLAHVLAQISWNGPFRTTVFSPFKFGPVLVEYGLKRLQSRFTRQPKDSHAKKTARRPLAVGQPSHNLHRFTCGPARGLPFRDFLSNRKFAVRKSRNGTRPENGKCAKYPPNPDALLLSNGGQKGAEWRGPNQTGSCYRVFWMGVFSQLFRSCFRSGRSGALSIRGFRPLFRNSTADAGARPGGAGPLRRIV